MAMKTFSKKYLLEELDAIGSAISSRIVHKYRWNTVYEIVFQVPEQPVDKAYRATYSVGNTESQDESPWQYEEEVECVEVELQPITRMEWVIV